MDYSKLMEWSRPLSAYAALSGGVNAWGLGGMGALKRGGFGAGGGAGSVSRAPWIGLGQSMRTSIQSYGGGGNRSSVTRSRHYSNAGFNKSQIVLQVFEEIGTPIADSLFAGARTDLRFQVGLEVSYANSLTGILPRLAYTFNGANFVRYDSTTWDGAIGYIKSDVLSHTYIPPLQFFGLWTTVEGPASQGSSFLPNQIAASSFINRFEGNIASASNSQIGAYGGNDAALTATSVTAFTASQSGGSNWFTPCMMLINPPAGTKLAVSIGDSIDYGIGEGGLGSSSFGDARGSTLGNMGWISRGIYENALINEVNLGKPTDRCQYLATAANWKYRRQLAALANPTHVVFANIHNDMAYSSTFPTWTATTAVTKWQVYKDFSKYYYAIQAGTTGGGSDPLGPPSQGIVDGTVIWNYLGASVGASTGPDGCYLVLSDIVNAMSQLQAALPNPSAVKFYQTLCTPDSSSSDSWATPGNQTVSAGFGPTARRHYANLNFTTPNLILSNIGTIGVINPNPYMEYTYPTETGLIVVNGVANYATQDTTHPNSNGAGLNSAAISPSTFT